ncbi:MAG TPA: baseplate J/gp47 family protein [Steroidobacteraceae bacterium]|nr:baseplate J/gp47 family protein [Steroidobacteraceae bacterium]
MAFARPTLTDLRSRIENDLVSRLQIVTTVLRNAVVRIIARVVAGAVHGLHGHIAWAVRQIFVTTADQEYIDLHGSELKVDRKPATFAAGSITITGTDASLIPSGTRWLRKDGIEYETTADATIASGTATAAVICTTEGASGNADAGVALSIISPIAGVTSTAVVAVSGVTNGVDVEKDEDYRARILQRKRNAPKGGSADDYENWALEVSGVTRVWVYRNPMGPGTVGVTFVLDNAVDIIPDSTKVDEVQAYLDDPSRRMLCASVDVYAPTAQPLNLTIDGIADLDVRAAIEDELRDLLFREGEPGGTILLSHIEEAISSARGENDHVLTSPVANISFGATELPVLGTITWT